MADPSSFSDAGAEPAGGSPPGMPRWVKVLGLVALVMAVLVVGVMLFAGGDHGPGRHTDVSEQIADGGSAPSEG